MSRSSFLLILRRIASVSAPVLLMAVCAFPASYKVLYVFTPTSANPSSGIIADAAGNVYGTTLAGGHDNSGTVYELSTETGYHLLYAFSRTGSAAGLLPQGNLVFDSTGNLYGTTMSGGIKNSACGTGCGVVFKLTPSPDGGPWTETVLYSFCSQANCADGAFPQAGVIFDSSGNLYGTTKAGGAGQGCTGGCGTVFELSSTGGVWTENVLYGFPVLPDGAEPVGSLIFDLAGNLYGTTEGGGDGSGGTVFELSPSGEGWTQNILYSFQNFAGSTDGAGPLGGLAFDASGNLYGTTATGGVFGSGEDSGFGTVFELSPSQGGWVETILYSFAGGNDGADPRSTPVLDLQGNLYGTTFEGGESRICDGFGCGTAFRLSPTQDGQWSEKLFRFASDQTGLQPTGSLLLDAEGNIYGTTTSGGDRNGLIDDGVVFRITP